MKKVVVAGCLCLDITPEFHDSQEKRKMLQSGFCRANFCRWAKRRSIPGEPLQIPDLRSDILARMCR